ncbi:hypothetical protein L6452_42819 [Arctium lappa]|uniref:Uncharacterized protein n=1 Tax=Arctium lappa TaxID=4217 RepID=A0ACB8XJP2_ARCLA|nr:hypothetical protein L6452_42819 [Arctium lappa]
MDDDEVFTFLNTIFAPYDLVMMQFGARVIPLRELEQSFVLQDINYNDPGVLAEVSSGLGEAMVGIIPNNVP